MADEWFYFTSLIGFYMNPLGLKGEQYVNSFWWNSNFYYKDGDAKNWNLDNLVLEASYHFMNQLSQKA